MPTRAISPPRHRRFFELLNWKVLPPPVLQLSIDGERELSKLHRFGLPRSAVLVYDGRKNTRGNLLVRMTPDKQAGLSSRFAQRVPNLQEDADVFLEAESFGMFAPLDDGNLLARFALTSDETFDVSMNPICALRLAATILDQLSKSGDYIIDLSIFEAASGEQTARIRSSAASSLLPAR